MNDNYPSILRRYLAALIDLIVALSIGVFIGKLLASGGGLSTDASFWVLALPFLLYEPIMTTTYATLGQSIFRIRVRKLDKTNKINIFQALPRLVIKYLLGWLSLMTIPARSDRRAIHDLATSTIMVNSNSA